MLNIVWGDGLLCLNGTTLLVFMIENTPYLDITILMESVVPTLGYRPMENANKKLQFIGAI